MRIGYPHVASTLALVVALGGTAYAAGLPRDSVGTAQLRDNAVTTAKVKDGTLRARDFGGQLPAGPQGPQGEQGPPGSDAEVTARLAASPLPGGGQQILSTSPPSTPQVRVTDVAGPAIARATAQISLSSTGPAYARVWCRLFAPFEDPFTNQEVATTLVRTSVDGTVVGGQASVSLSGYVGDGDQGDVGIGCWYDSDAIGVPTGSNQVTMSAARVVVQPVESLGS